MQENGSEDITKQTPIKIEKVVSLFKYIKELNKVKQKIISDVSQYKWYKSIASFPDDPENIRVFYRDRTEDEDADDGTDILVSVHKPEFQRCPQPYPSFLNWLNDGWDDYRKDVTIKEYILQSDDDSNQAEYTQEYDKSYAKIYFEDSAERTNEYEKWKILRDVWVEKQKLIARTRDFFVELHNLNIDLERESETLELIVADGFIREKEMPEIDHPVLTRRVRISHDAEKNNIYIEDSNAESELYTVIFQIMKNINLSSVKGMNAELLQNDYHPLDRNETASFFKILAHKLTADSVYSENGIPDKWDDDESVLIYRNPCYILRKRMDGTIKAIEKIIEIVEKTGNIPKAIEELVEGGKIEIPEDSIVSIEEQLAAVGGESIDILLSKEANKEQLEIARRIERYNAVLVQGPPGTGKTHTIANLMGHFLAQGKSVLVTSHTKKALRVLKEKVVTQLQDLCVSMIDDTNTDMERSVDGIIAHMSETSAAKEKREMLRLGIERKKVIDELAEVRKKLFEIIKQEYSSIKYNGKDVLVSDMANYIQDNSEALSYIPGSVSLYKELPLSLAEISELYKTNEDISAQEETELENNIPDPREIMSPSDFEKEIVYINSIESELRKIASENEWEINILNEEKIEINTLFGSFDLQHLSSSEVSDLRGYLSAIDNIEPWMLHCAIDGKEGGAYKQRWIVLIDQIQKTCDQAENIVVKKLGKEVNIQNSEIEFRSAMKQLAEKYRQKSKISKFSRLLNKQLETALNGATINGHQPQNEEECQLILDILEFDSAKERCASYWNDLMVKLGVPEFSELDPFNPERVALNYISMIQYYLDWFKNYYEVLTAKIDSVGIKTDMIFQKNVFDSEYTYIEKCLCNIKKQLPIFCDVFDIVNRMRQSAEQLKTNINNLQEGDRINSDECKAIIAAAQTNNINDYREAYNALENTFAKYSIKLKREKFLNRLSQVAPEWAEAICSRDGIHGYSTMPENIEVAWTCKQYEAIIDEITSEPFNELKKKSVNLSRQYRKITAMFAEKSAWYNLLKRTEGDISLQQALNGWKLTVKKIGKGTGKNAPRYRKEARRLMIKCQEAVPAWIMPIGKALESLNPEHNRFDIVIIDEASQSYISSLAILYMGKKLIIVGDDKQVSPMGIGVDEDKVNALKEMYIAKKIPNAHLYDAKTSIYDIAATTFQPLMLKEHFRCMPEIIGFSNWLSYDFKIKPLRDPSNSVLLPSVVNYRVENGERINKTNPNEAKAIAALMQACIDQPEYESKSFGIISLLGDDQVYELQKEINRLIDPKEFNKRRILCGNASHFQGDERDVVFLSLVDCANGNGPVSKVGFGRDDSTRKRYNVAASRAKDQLWIVDSLDHENDLKPGDIRKQLIEYSIDPKMVSVINDKIDINSESPFEASVAKQLTLRGYHIVQQWHVGAYRLDMVAIFGIKKVAIECDGEQYHSGEEKIREDLERQTILERIGWDFIRIRGSEFYKNPDKAIERVINELTELGIEPEEINSEEIVPDRNTELLQRIKRRAEDILIENKDMDSGLDHNTIRFALDNKNSIPELPFADKKSEAVWEFVTDQKPSYQSKNEINKKKRKAQSMDMTPVENMKVPEQITLDFIVDQETADNDIIGLLKSEGVQFIDKRPKGGSLWVVGGKEIYKTIEKAKQLGYTFHYKKEGGKATRNKPGWWTK